MTSDLSVPPVPGGPATQLSVLECERVLLGEPPVRADRSLIVGKKQQYEVVKSLGVGGMGKVELAWDSELDRQVAIKLVRSGNPTGRRDLEDRLYEEAKALARLSHDNIVKVLGFDRTPEGQPFIVMDYVPGQTLKDWVAEHDPSLRQLLDLLIDAGRGLEAVHDAGLVHRDFKPSNVLVREYTGRPPRALVSDFGLACTYDSTSAQASTLEDGTQSTKAKPRRPSGTRHYQAPELLAGASADAASDQYAFCVSAWDLITRAGPPSEGGRAWRRPPRMPRWLYRVLSRGLEADPAQRHPDMASLLAALERGPRPRRLALSVGLVGLFGLSVGFATAREAPAQDHCTHQDEVEALWSPDDRERVEAQLAKVAGDANEALVERALKVLDGAAQGWRQRQRELCRRSWLDRVGHLSRCENLWQRRFERHVDLLSSIEADELIHVPELLESLSEPGCGELAAPIDYDVAELLDRSRDMTALGDYETALSLAEQALQLAQGLGSCGSGWGYERSAAHLQLGTIFAKRSNPKAALAEFEAAVEQATACGDDIGRHRKALMGEAEVLALQLHDAEAAEAKLGLVRALNQQAENSGMGPLDPVESFELSTAEAAIAYREGRYEDARKHYLAAHEVIAGHDLMREAEARMNLGSMAVLQGNTDMAEAYWSKLGEELGPTYAEEKRAILAANLGELALAKGEDELAREQFERAASSARLETKLAGFNGLLALELKRVTGGESKNYADGLALTEHIARELRGLDDLPVGRFALLLYRRGRLRLLAFDDEEFMRGPQAQVTAVLDGGLDDLERSLAIWRGLPPSPRRYRCALFLAWYLHDIHGHERHARARRLLDEALAHMRPGDLHYRTAATLDERMRDSSFSGESFSSSRRLDN